MHQNVKGLFITIICVTIIALLTTTVYVQFAVRRVIISHKHIQACDEECRRFERLMDAWPVDKPKAAVVILLRKAVINRFAHSVRQLDANFNDAYHYPLIVFHEEELNNQSQRNHLRSLTKSNLFLQVVHFDIPPFVNRSAVPTVVLGRTVGYRHMCRFHAKTLYDEPIIARLQYVWRLDDDSFICRPVRYDVFRMMRDRRLQYGYTSVTGFGYKYRASLRELWLTVDNYTRRHDIRSKFNISVLHVYYNNFEISDLDVWRSPEYRSYVDNIDRTGGMFYYLWGDASIKTIAVTLFIERDRTHQFRNIKYRHFKKFGPD